jgi:protein-disulfide isomerase
LPEIDRQYLRTGKALLVWRHYPLPVHENARKAAEGAECADRQGRFWEFHDWAFQHQKELDPANLRVGAKAVGLDLATFGACLNGQATAEVQADVDLGKAVSISGTPSWLIGVVQPDGKVKVVNRLTGAKPFAVFQEAIDKVITTIGRSDD